MAIVILKATDTNYTISNNNDIVYGTDNASETITISAGVSGVVIDASIETVSVAGNVAAFTYKQVGNLVEVYSGADLVVKIPANPIQTGDTTTARQIAFTDGTVGVGFNGGTIELGGSAVSSESKDVVVPATKDTAIVVAITNSTSGKSSVEEKFVWTQSNAVGHSALTNFGISEDSIQFNLAGTEQVTTTLDKLNGYSLSGEGMISVSLDQFTQETIIGLGNDSQGQPLALTLVGVTDASQVDVSVI
jgi:hypothetical protein